MDESGNTTILKAFSKAVRGRCARAFWERVERHFDSEGTNYLSQRFGARLTRVYEWRAGEMSLENFYCILTELGWGYADAGVLPSIQDRFATGIHAAVRSALPGERAKVGDSLSLVEFIAVEILVGDEQLVDIIDEGRKPSVLEWKDITTRVATKLARLGLSSTLLPPQRLPHLYDQWQDIVTRVCFAIPYNWMERGSDGSSS